jgi:hypothetical protein
MTNEVTTQQPQLPAFLQAHLQVNKPSADVASLATAQNSTPRLSLRGKIFRLINGDQEVKVKDDLKVYIVGVEPAAGAFTKTYYASQYAGAESAGNPPDCASGDGIRPDPWIQQPQHADCKSCPKNQFGSSTSRGGKPSKACHDSKRLYISRVEDPMGTLYLSQIPVSSLKELARYGKELSDMGVEPWMVQTKMSMDDESEFPTLSFAVDGFISEDMMAAMKERAAKREWAVARNMMLQSPQQRQALPAHLAQALGTTPAAPAAAPVNNLAAPTVDPNLIEKAAQVTAESGKPASNAEILKNW